MSWAGLLGSGRLLIGCFIDGEAVSSMGFGCVGFLFVYTSEFYFLALFVGFLE